MGTRLLCLPSCRGFGCGGTERLLIVKYRGGISKSPNGLKEVEFGDKRRCHKAPL